MLGFFVDRHRLLLLARNCGGDCIRQPQRLEIELFLLSMYK